MCLRGTIGRITPWGYDRVHVERRRARRLTSRPAGWPWLRDEEQLAVGRLRQMGGYASRAGRFGGFPSLRAITAGLDDNLWLTYKRPQHPTDHPFGKYHRV